MRVVTSSLVAAGVIAGIAVGVSAYQAAAHPGPPHAKVAAPAAAEPTLEPAARWQPCEPRTHLVGGTCVRVVRRVVVHIVPPATASVPASVTIAPRAVPVRHHSAGSGHKRPVNVSSVTTSGKPNGGASPGTGTDDVPGLDD